MAQAGNPPSRSTAALRQMEGRQADEAAFSRIDSPARDDIPGRADRRVMLHVAALATFRGTLLGLRRLMACAQGRRPPTQRSCAHRLAGSEKARLPMRAAAGAAGARFPTPLNLVPAGGCG